MYEVGDKIRYTEKDFEYIPFGTIGEIVEVHPQGFYSVYFKGVEHNNNLKDKETWTVVDEEMELLRSFTIVDGPEISSEKPLERPTLTIPIVEGVEFFRGQFEDSEGQVYSVHVEKIPGLVKKQV